MAIEEEKPETAAVDAPEDGTPEEPTKAAELEADAPEDKRAKIKASDAGINLGDTTVNAVPAANGKLLMCLTDGGFQYLLSGARAAVGVKSGRYMFEAKIVEALSPSEPAAPAPARGPSPKQLLRVGFSLKGSSLFLSDGPDSICFDSEGLFSHDKIRKRASQKFVREQTVAVVLNLDANSPNANTVSLFRNGERVSEPQPLPEGLKGKALYPTVTYRNVTVQLNFGPSPLHALPFRCTLLGAAAKDDVEVVPTAPDDKKGTVLFPVGLPEAGYFDWVDQFLSKNPDFIELSDRKILEWASKSGMWKNSGQQGTSSNDKPDMRFGLRMMDDQSVRRLLRVVAPTLKRNYIIPEMRMNLVPADRKALVDSFGGDFKKVARVIVGPPDASYKAFVQEAMLAEKKKQVVVERKRKAQEDMRKRLFEKRRKMAEDVKKAKEAGLKPPIFEDEKKDEDDEMAADEAEPIAVELSEEEKALVHRQSATPDMLDTVLAKYCSSFALPTKEEGFDEVAFDWAAEKDCQKLLSDWILAKKLKHKVEDIKPGTFFNAEWAKWQKMLQEWRRRQAEYKDPSKRKAILAKKMEEEAKAKGEEYVPPADDEDGEDAEAVVFAADDVDVNSVEDVNDVGKGEPLYHRFAYEDWMLVSLRYELHLLLHAFPKDSGDADRTAFGEDHLAFYYSRYFKKQLTLSSYNLAKTAELVGLVKDSLAYDPATSMLKALRAEDATPESFLKVTEEQRRDRQKRMEAGDETAQLVFAKPGPQQPAGRPVPTWGPSPPGLRGPTLKGTVATNPYYGR